MRRLCSRGKFCVNQKEKSEEWVKEHIFRCFLYLCENTAVFTTRIIRIGIDSLGDRRHSAFPELWYRATTTPGTTREKYGRISPVCRTPGTIAEDEMVCDGTHTDISCRRGEEDKIFSYKTPPTHPASRYARNLYD